MNKESRKIVIKEDDISFTNRKREVYLVVYNGYLGKYGSEIYLYGVFDSERLANEAINKCSNKDKLNFTIVKSIMNNVNSMYLNDGEDIYENDAYLGGYIE